jgi:hypothetical protein
MNKLLKLKSILAVLTIALLAGCAGITEANLTDTNEAFDTSADTPVTHQDLPDLFNGGDQEDIIEVRPRDRYEGRE